MVASVLIPRLALRVACAGIDSRQEGAAASPHGSSKEPLALAPAPGAGQAIGEVSRAAEEQGVRAGMRLGEALARSPSLQLVRADPARTAELWEGVLCALEGIGAAVESERAGEAFFAVDGLRGLYGGDIAGVVDAAREDIVRSGPSFPVRIAVAPTRFAAFAAASRGPHLPRGVSGERAEAIVPPRALSAFLAPLPVSTLAPRLAANGRPMGELAVGGPGVDERAAARLVTALKRFGIRTLGAFVALPAAQVADRFGPLGLQALRLARGEDAPLRPRDPHEEVAAEITLPEGAAGPQLDRALELLVDRLLAAPERRGRTVLELRLDALLCGGGSWSVELGLGRASASAQTLCLLLAPRLAGLPEPAESLSLRATGLGAPAAEQLTLSAARIGAGEEEGPSHRRLSTSIRELRTMQGAEALLKAIDIDAASRIPERRVVLTPYPDL
jgi:protein ImuB